jgi:two-component system LytT family response regulator
VTLRVVIVDDEPPARAKLRRYLADHPDFEVAGEADCGRRALETIARLRPDVIFLDVSMPDMDGFEVVERMSAEGDVDVVFVTAHAQFGDRAFDAEASDYLLKPVDVDRFERTLMRIRAGRAGGTARSERLVISGGGRWRLIPAERVDWIEAAGNYVIVHAGGQSHTLRVPLKTLEARLDPGRFARLHRSQLVNLDRVAEVQPASHGDSMVVLRDGTKLTLSRRYRQRLWAKLA